MPLPLKPAPEPRDIVDFPHHVSGWLNRAGLFFVCGHQAHYHLAKRLMPHHYPEEQGRDPREGFCGDPQAYLEARGWLKLSLGDVYYFASIHTADFPLPSPEQVQTLERWHQASPRWFQYNRHRCDTWEDFLPHVRP